MEEIKKIEICMEKLKEIEKGYFDLFVLTGKIEYFMKSRSLKKMQTDIGLEVENKEEQGLSL